MTMGRVSGSGAQTLGTFVVTMRSGQEALVQRGGQVFKAPGTQGYREA